MRANCLILTLSIIGFAASALLGCAANHPFNATIESSATWHLSEDCRVYQYGILTDPDCHILAGNGIVISITKIRRSKSSAGGDSYATIGIKFKSDQGLWYLSQPFAVVTTQGADFVTVDIDEAIAFEQHPQPASPQRLDRGQQRYELPFGKQRFFRLRFAVPQAAFDNGFTLHITGLYKADEAVQVPLITFN